MARNRKPVGDVNRVTCGRVTVGRGRFYEADPQTTMSDRDESPGRRIRCAWDGCWRHTSQPYTDGWANLVSWGPAVQDGFYCQPHAEALEAVLMDGGFEGM
jgi:hypothetical protein